MIRSKKHLCAVIGLNTSELKEVLSNLSNFYYEKKEEKRDKKGNLKLDKNGNTRYRIMYPSKGILKKVQARLKSRVFDKTDFPIYIQGGIKGRDNISNALFHKGNKYFFQTDLKNFFPSIRYKQIYKMLICRGFSPDVASIITKLTTYQGRLPQGTPTSTALANLTFWMVDEDLISFCEQNDLRFSRFVDDIAISGKKPFKHLSQDIIGLITQHGYAISRKKTYYKTGNVNITGCFVHNNFLDTTNEFKENWNSNTLSEASNKGKLLYQQRVKYVGRQKRRKVFKETASL